MKKLKDDILYSEPVKELMGTPPPRITRWGNFMLLSVFLLSLLLSLVIRYPDTIPSPVTITTINPPVELVAKFTGRINNLFVKEGETVKAGETIGIMETTASFIEIEELRSLTSSHPGSDSISVLMFPQLSYLGELQSYYALFLKNLYDLRSFDENDYLGSKIRSLIIEIQSIDEYLARLRVKEKLYSENLVFEKKKFQRDSVLFKSSVISESSYEVSYQSLLKMKIDLQQVRLEFSSKSIEKAEKSQLMQDFSIKKSEERENLVSVLRESYMNLKSQLYIWENKFLFISPVAGTVSYTKVWSKNQTVMADEAVINIIPADAGRIVGRVFLKMHRSGKVKKDQEVNIKLSGFPYLEYGVVKGIVQAKSLVPTGDAYVIEIELPEGLTTTYKKKLEFTQNMTGIAEIVTEDKRLIQRIINPFRYIIDRSLKH